MDNQHEVAVGFTGGDAGMLRIKGMGFFDPDIVTFYGSDPKAFRENLNHRFARNAVLHSIVARVEHVSQLNMMRRALPKQIETEAPRRIGFRPVQDFEKA
jgi:hypothetical protein